MILFVRMKSTIMKEVIVLFIATKTWSLAVWIQFIIEVLLFIKIYYHLIYQKYNNSTRIYLTLFYFYIVSILFVTLLPLDFQDFQIGNWWYFSYNNFTIPFRDIINQYDGAIRDVILNTILFIPFGLLFPLCFECRFIKTAFIGLLSILSIETLQMLFSLFCINYRTFDITDIITNFIGVCIGYILYKVFLALKNNVLIKI